jgi:DNA repair exonuclease SbcCD ATPase subunit
MDELATQLADEDLFDQRIARLDALAEELQQVEQTLADGPEAQQTAAEQIVRRRVQLVAKAARLEEETQRLDARRDLTRIQRQRIANWLRAQRNALNEERETFERESKRALQQLKRERAKCNKEREEFEELRCNLEANLSNGVSATDAAELAQLQSDRSLLNSRVQQLEHQLAEAEQRLASQPPEHDSTEIDDLQRRFEMAIDDVRELKHRNAELEEALAEIQAEVGQPAEGANIKDWEATKRHLMSALDQEGEEGESLNTNDRLTVDGAIRITDEIVAQRDIEIGMLKDQLAQCNGNANDAAAGASSNEQIFNQDEVIRQERERLAALKQELREKLRQAEVELSVQRAGVARERAELQERLRALEADRDAVAAQQSRNPALPADKSKKPARRWLERMGLKELDQE